MEMEKVVDSPRGRFVIRPYQESDEDGALSLWHAAFGKEMSHDLWRWKYLANPYGQQMMLCVSETGQPVAMYAGIPYKAKLRGEEIRFSHLVDNMSHPDFRGVVGGRRGLFVQTAEEFFNHYGGPRASVFIYGFPGRRNFLLGIRILQGKELPGGASFLRAMTLDLEEKVRPFRGKIVKIMPPYEIFERPFGMHGELYPFAVIRNREFLEWRFGKHPERSYEIWVYRSKFGRQIKAYAALFLEAMKAYMVDLVASSSVREMGDFMARLGRVLTARGIETIETWLPSGHFLQQSLVNTGFDALEEPLGIVPAGRIFDSSLSFDWVAKNIFYTMADGDVF
jgi:hypothetical protein